MKRKLTLKSNGSENIKQVTYEQALRIEAMGGRLDKFFHQQIGHSKADEQLKADLIRDTVYRVCKRISRDGLPRGYTLETFVFLQAQDVWNIYLKKANREKRTMRELVRTVQVAGNLETEVVGAIDAKDTLAKQKPDDRKLIIASGRGATGVELANMLDISPAAARQRLFRLRKNL